MPSFIYYLALYVLIIVTNYFRIKGEQSDPTTPEYKFPWRRIFFVSNEIIYTGSGVYIILLANPDWVGPIMVLLILLTVVSLYMVAMAEKFSDQVKFITHSIIIFIIISATFSTYFNTGGTHVIKNKADTIMLYKVVLPYSDISLLKNYDYENFDKHLFFYQKDTTANNESEAILKVTESFWKDPSVEPIILDKNSKAKKVKKRNMLKIDNNNIVVKALNKT